MTVVISSAEDADWGDLDLTDAFAEVKGTSPADGMKYFVEMYWLDAREAYRCAIIGGAYINDAALCIGKTTNPLQPLVFSNGLVLNDMCFFSHNQSGTSLQIYGFVVKTANYSVYSGFVSKTSR